MLQRLPVRGRKPSGGENELEGSARFLEQEPRFLPRSGKLCSNGQMQRLELARRAWRDRGVSLGSGLEHEQQVQAAVLATSDQLFPSRQGQAFNDAGYWM